jgi:hypothetical protein
MCMFGIDNLHQADEGVQLARVLCDYYVHGEASELAKCASTK